MSLRFLAAQSLLKQAVLALLCLSIMAGEAAANVLPLITPAAIVKKLPLGPHWRTPQLLSNTRYKPKIAMDAAGNAIAIWSDNNNSNIWVNRYVAGNGWGTSQIIGTGGMANEHPQIAVNAAGNAIAVWIQLDSYDQSIWVNQYIAGVVWSTAQRIATTTHSNYIGVPQVAIDSSGNAVAVWQQSDGTRSNIWANHYTAASNGWDTAQLIETDDTGDARYPQVAVDSVGNALAVWEQSDGIRRNIWASRYAAAGNSWGTAQLIETNNAGDAYSPDVVMDADGNALAAWTQSDGTVWNTWANRYVAGAGWDIAELIGTNNGSKLTTNEQMGSPVPRIAIAMNAYGNAFAVWTKDEKSPCGAPSFTTQANRYVAGTGWSAAERIGEKVPAGPACVWWSPDMAVGIDASGNALAIWSQPAPPPSDPLFREDIWANRYVAGKGWCKNELIETNTTDSAIFPQIAMDAAGNAIAVWMHQDGTQYSIWAARYE